MPVLRVQANPPLASGISRMDLADEILADILAEVETGLAAQLEALYNTVTQTQNTLRGKAEEIAGLHDRISKLETGLNSKDGELLREQERLESEKKAAVQMAGDLARGALEALKDTGLEALKEIEEKTKNLEQTYKELQDNNSQLQEEKKQAQAELGSVREVLKQVQEDLDACKLSLEHCNARAASQGPSDPDVVLMTVKLGMDFKAAGDEGSLQRSKFEKDLVSDLATASGVAADRFKIRKLAPGSVLVGVDIYPEPSGRGPSAAEVSEELENQADDPSSPLRRGKVTSSVSDIALPHQQLLEHEELKRLRATCKKKLAKELVDKGAQQQSEESKLLDELVRTTRDLERQLAASQHQVAHLRETKAKYEHVIAQLEGELAATLASLQQEVGKDSDATADNETVVPVRRGARKALRSAPPLPLSLKEQQETEGAGKRDAEACAEKFQVLKLSQLSGALEDAKQRHLQDGTVKRLSQDPDTEARTSDLERALDVLKAEHQQRAAALEARLAELGGALALLQENEKEQLTRLARLRAEEEQQKIEMYKIALHTQCAIRIKKMQADLKVNANLFSGGLEGLENELNDIHTRFMLVTEDAAERAKSYEHALEDLRNKVHYATQDAFTVKQQMKRLRDQYEQQLRPSEEVSEATESAAATVGLDQGSDGEEDASADLKQLDKAFTKLDASVAATQAPAASAHGNGGEGVENVQGACRDGQLVQEESRLPGGEDSDESADNESVAPMRRKTRRTLRSAAPLLLPPPACTDQEGIPAIKREERGVCKALPPAPADSTPVDQGLVEGDAGVRATAGGEDFSVSHKTPSAPHREGGRKAYTWGQSGWAPILACDTDLQDFEIIPAHSPSESVNHHGASDAMHAWSPSPSAQHAETVQASGVLEPVSLGSTPPSSPAGNIKKPSPSKPQLGLDFTSWFGAFGAVVQVPAKTPNSLSPPSRAAASAPKPRATSQTSYKDAQKVTLRSQLPPATPAPAASTMIPGQLFLDGEELIVQDPALDMLNCLCDRTVPYRVVIRNGAAVCQPAESATGSCRWVCVDCGQVHGAATVPTPIDLSSVSPTP